MISTRGPSRSGELQDCIGVTADGYRTVLVWGFAQPVLAAVAFSLHRGGAAASQLHQVGEMPAFMAA